jgi:outer membrane lipoprotein SlyB
MGIDHMRKFVVALLCFGSLAVGSTAVEAKGCIKGALVGGVAGHYAGHHAILGAVGGCLAGRHLAKQRANAAQAPVPDQSPK